jgi:hypothetical protein
LGTCFLQSEGPGGCKKKLKRPAKIGCDSMFSDSQMYQKTNTSENITLT